jgi:hypothetical protein
MELTEYILVIVLLHDPYVFDNTKVLLFSCLEEGSWEPAF